jgi:protein-disulfide isomerase
MSKRQDMIARRRKQQEKTKRAVIIGVIAVGVVLVFLAFITSTPLGKSLGNLARSATPTPAIKAEDIIIPSARSYPMVNKTSMGDPNAPVKVEEFSNFLCSHCQAFTETQEPTIVDKYIATGKVYWTYTSFVWQPESQLASEAAYCARDQNQFFPYRDIAFANSGNEAIGGLTDASLLAFAETLKLDMTQFRTCFQSHQYKNQVQDDETRSQAMGVTGTPTFILNTKQYSAAEIVAAIEAALSATK